MLQALTRRAGRPKQFVATVHRLGRTALECIGPLTQLITGTFDDGDCLFEVLQSAEDALGRPSQLLYALSLGRGP